MKYLGFSLDFYPSLDFSEPWLASIIAENVEDYVVDNGVKTLEALKASTE